MQPEQRKVSPHRNSLPRGSGAPRTAGLPALALIAGLLLLALGSAGALRTEAAPAAPSPTGTATTLPTPSTTPIVATAATAPATPTPTASPGPAPGQGVKPATAPSPAPTATFAVTPVAGTDQQRVPLHAGWNWFSFSTLPGGGSGLVAGSSPTAYFCDLFGSATLDWAPVPAGAVVEAFDPRGTLVGWSTVREPGRYGYMRVYGEDPTTNPPLPGIRQGEPITFKVDGYPATPSRPYVWERFLMLVQLDLAATTDLALSEVTASLGDRFDYLLGEDGTYAPPPALQALNTLRALKAGKQYFLRMKEPGELFLQGRRLTANTPLQLAPGWRWVGYLGASSQDLPAALGSIAGKYDFVLGEGGTYAPLPADPSLNSLPRRDPGRGYLLRMRESGVLVYGP